MSMIARVNPNTARVLAIAGAWTLFLVLSYTDSYLLTQDLIRSGELAGVHPFLPNLLGNTIVGVFGGLVGGSLLVLKVNAGYRHRTFFSGIGMSAVYFLSFYLIAGSLILFLMGFAFYAAQGGLVSGARSAWDNVLLNVNTPSYLSSMVIWGTMVSGTQFMLQVNDKFGPGVLWKLITGRYYNPREEERVFMFLDLQSSTTLAERLGPRRFFELLRELFQDITSPVLRSKGEIYQYVGDEVVITWPARAGLTDGNCLRCFFRVDAEMERRRPEYMHRYGVSPQFKAGLHIGTATVGEIGVVKKDIVYSGDVLNTASRIQAECNRYGTTLLISDELVARLPETITSDLKPIGEIALRGKSEPTRMFALSTLE